MISLASDFTDGKGRHARGWLFFDRDCRFCAGLARVLAGPMRRRGLDLAPLQDPRVGVLVAVPPEELMSAIRFVSEEGKQAQGVDALLSVAREFGWARPVVWFSRIPGAVQVLRTSYLAVTHFGRCAAQPCTRDRSFRAS
jgi:predicted DCC family thiol-disulfide oxidoreductase YuxK